MCQLLQNLLTAQNWSMRTKDRKNICSKTEFTNRNLLVITFIRLSLLLCNWRFSVFTEMSRHERSFIVFSKWKRISEMQAAAAARSTKFYSNDVMCAPLRQSIVYGICWLSGQSGMKRWKKCRREAKKERISDIILPINNKFLFTSFTTRQACEKEKHKNSTLNFFSFSMAFFVSFSYSPSCGTLQRYYLSSFVTTSNFSSRRISLDVFFFFVWWKVVKRAPEMWMLTQPRCKEILLTDTWIALAWSTSEISH